MHNDLLVQSVRMRLLSVRVVKRELVQLVLAQVTGLLRNANYAINAIHSDKRFNATYQGPDLIVWQTSCYGHDTKHGLLHWCQKYKKQSYIHFQFLEFISYSLPFGMIIKLQSQLSSSRSDHSILKKGGYVVLTTYIQI